MKEEDRKYSVEEIDALRKACEDRYVWGTSYREGVGRGCSRAYSAEKMMLEVEQKVRTYMLAGVTAEDIVDTDRRKAEVGSDSEH